MIRIHGITLLICYIFFTCSFLNESQAQNKGWTLILQEKQMRVFTRKMETSHVKEVKILGSMIANMDTIKNILTDVEKYPNWIYKCVKSKRFNIIDNANYHYYIETDFPFPFESRDVVIRTKNWTDKHGVWHTISVADPKAIPVNKNIVRLSKYNSRWTIKSDSSNQLNYEYYFHAEPAGKVPIWVINLGAEKGPMRTIKTLEARSKKLINIE